MEIGYIVKSHGHTIKDAIYFKDIPSMDYYDQEELIRYACEYAWDHADGWEWLREGEIITLIINGVDCGDFPVDVDYEPVFMVGSKIKEK